MPANRVSGPVASAPVATGAGGPVKVMLNGKPVTFDVPPRLVNGRVMVPARALFESLGLQVGWDEASKTVSGRGPGADIRMRIGDPRATVNGEERTLDVPPMVADGRTLIPLRFVAEATGAKVGWDAATGTATVDNGSNDEVLLVGMNEGSAHEAQQLGKQAKVTYVKDSFENDKVKGTDERGAKATFDLATPEGSRAFARGLGLPAAQAEAIAQAIDNTYADARDELAQIAQVWAKAEKGGLAPARLVLSGHSVGGGIWGDGNGYLDFDALGALAEAMPRAARMVEDLHISGCYSAGERTMDRCRAMFPNVKSIWAYSGSAPGSYVGAVEHQKQWEAATRFSRTDLSRDVARGTYKGDNVAVWTATRGYSDGKPPVALAEVRAEVAGNEWAYRDGMSGQLAIPDSQNGPVREYYNALQRLLQHPELPDGERGELESRRDQTIRLLYYSGSVAAKFSAKYGEQVRKGYESVGLPVPDFKALSRADALARIAELERKAGASADARALLPLLQDGLRDLRPSVIPASWV